MDLVEFIIEEGQKKGLSEDEIAKLLINAYRKFPGKASKEKWEGPVLSWINDAASGKSAQVMSENNNGIDLSMLKGQNAPLPQGNGSFEINEFGEVIREEPRGKLR